MRFIFCLFISIVITGSCTSSRVISPHEYKGNQIIISSGGGISGQWTTWYLLADGQCFRQEGIAGTVNFTQKLTKDKTRQCFDLIQGLSLEERSFIHPGNMTYSLGWKHEGQVYQVKWGESGLDTPKDFESAYSRLMSIISPQNK